MRQVFFPLGTIDDLSFMSGLLKLRVNKTIYLVRKLLKLVYWSRNMNKIGINIESCLIQRKRNVFGQKQWNGTAVLITRCAHVISTPVVSLFRSQCLPIRKTSFITIPNKSKISIVGIYDKEIYELTTNLLLYEQQHTISCVHVKVRR